MNKQVLIIHGGSVFQSYKDYLADLKSEKIDVHEKRSGGEKGWKDTLDERLGKGFEVMYPEMPTPGNARFLEWSIWFEKFIPHLHDGVILIGHSLGGIFLAKYLSENKFPKKITATFLVAAPYFDISRRNIGKDWILPKSLSKLAEQGGTVFLYQSTDDELVGLINFKKYTRALPDAVPVIFKNKGHFRLKDFPEIVKEIKKISHE